MKKFINNIKTKATGAYISVKTALAAKKGEDPFSWRKEI